MAFTSIFYIVLTTNLCIIDKVLCGYINSRCVNGYEIGHYKLSTLPRFRRDLNDLENFGGGEEAGFFPEYLRIFDKIIPDMKNRIDIIKGNLFIPRSSENYSSEVVPPTYIKIDQLDSSRGGYVNEDEKEAHQELNTGPETVLTEDSVNVENKVPDSYLVQEPNNQIDWGKGVEDQVALNAHPDRYKFTQDLDLNSNEEVGSFGDGVMGCYNHCLQNCYGTNPGAPRPRYESSRQAKPLVINIKSECLSHPNQRFPHRYPYKPKLNINPFKFHHLPKKIHKYSSCPFSEMNPFYY